ncbi:MAG: hypothetical protein NTZ69_00140 [Bacteroidia bacterium]|nr:hypothetical protein [Bacteroidia bacterium]
MKNKANALDLTIRDSGSYKNFIAPDYPDYPDCDDIYNTFLDRNEIGPINIFKTKALPQRSKNMKPS